jgi:hypothetical protein
MQHLEALATAAVRWFVTLPLNFQTVIICLTFVVPSGLAL